MSDDAPTWWNFTMEESVKLVLEYMPVKSRAVIASSLSVRAWSELEEYDLESETSEELIFRGCEEEEPEAAHAHPVWFVSDDKKLKYPVCVVVAPSMEQVRRLLWWLQRAQPRSMQLQRENGMSADELRQVLDLLLSDKPVVPGYLPLHTNLFEFDIAATKVYECANVLNRLACCLSLRKLDLSWCVSVQSLEGLEKLVHLEELDVSHTMVKDVTWLRNCTSLACLHTIKFCGCSELQTTAGVEGLRHLQHIDLTASVVTNLVGLEHCTSLRTVNMRRCEAWHDAGELRELHFLEAVDVKDTQVGDLSFLGHAEWLKKLNLSYTTVDDLSPLQYWKFLRELSLDSCEHVKSIEALAGLVYLTRLKLCDTSVSNIEPLTNCTRLTVLNLSNCHTVESITALRNMSELQELNLSNTSVKSLVPLEGCVQMRKLWLYGCKSVQSVAPLSKMAALAVLNLSFTSVHDVTPLAGCLQLQKLDLLACLGVRNVRVLENMPHLEHAILSHEIRDEVVTSTGSSEAALNCVWFL